MTGRPLIVASHPAAQDGGEQLSADGGSAMDALIGAFLAAAASDEAVMFAPVIGLVAGVGAGARSIDGRGCQPGAGAKRPRGLLADDPIPVAARAAVPRSLAALALLHAYGGTRTLRVLARPALAIAKSRGADALQRFIASFIHHGPATLVESQVSRALCAAAGGAAGGLLGEADLRRARPGDDEALSTRHGDLELTSVPWAESPRHERPAQVIVAADGRGLVGALAYCPDPDGVLVPELGVRLAGDATPVMRGVPRVTPGTPLAAPCPIAILSRPTDGWFAAFGAAGAPRLDESCLLTAAAPLKAQLERLREALGCGRAVAASVQRGHTAAATL
jgi:gamma-glutamyltranspeptidase/glutathione hydrolase